MQLLAHTLVMLLALAMPLHAAGDVRVSETRSVPAGVARDASHELPLHLYVFRGSRWQPDDVLRALPGVSALLSQCGMAIGPVELHIIDAPPRYHLYSTPVSRELLGALKVSRPAVFFVDDTLNRPAFDAETIGLANARSRPELAQTIWVAYNARDLSRALAHELMHLLANSGEHSAEPGNLMRAETSPGNTMLTAAQCAQARLHGTAQGVLIARPR